MVKLNTVLLRCQFSKFLVTMCAAGFEFVTGQKWVVRAFFFCFHVLAVVGLSNVVTSFIINAFFQQMKTIEQRKGSR